MNTNTQREYTNIASYYFAEREDFWIAVVVCLRHKDWIETRVNTLN